MIATSSEVGNSATLVFSNMSFSKVAYILALVFQLTAGVMLLLGNMGITKKQVISNYCIEHRIIRLYPNGDLKDYEEFIETAKRNWMNQIAFFFLFLGYLVSIFGEAPKNKIYTLIIVIVFTIFLLILVSIFTSAISKIYGKINFNEYILNKGTLVMTVPEDRKNKK